MHVFLELNFVSTRSQAQAKAAEQRAHKTASQCQFDREHRFQLDLGISPVLLVKLNDPCLALCLASRLADLPSETTAQAQHTTMSQREVDVLIIGAGPT